MRAVRVHEALGNLPGPCGHLSILPVAQRGDAQGG